MKIGIAIGNFDTFGKHADAADLVETACRAEAFGFDSVWAHDHLFMPAAIRSRYPYNESGVAGFAYRQNIYDPLAVLAAVATRTQRVELGTSVLIVPYRNPLILAKMLATLDQLCRGRLLLGIGVGWMQEEFDELGIGEHFSARGRVTDEWMRICIELWTREGPASFDGHYHQFSDLHANPKPARKPHIPIWVGGKGAIAARRVARYGQGYHSISSTPEELTHEFAQVREALEQAGRDPAEITFSMLGPMIHLDEPAAPNTAAVGGSNQQIIDGLAAYAAVGLEHALCFPTTPGISQPTPSQFAQAMQRVAEDVLPALR